MSTDARLLRRPNDGPAASQRAAEWWFVRRPDTGGYRPDIDTLRAIAVGLVIAFHLGIHRLAGGFIGVDVFFVISGFLIGSQILVELREGRFSIVKFYERRVRRILPALFVVLIATTLMGFFWLYPGRYATLGTSLAAAAASLENLYQLTTADFLAGTGASTALSHTWSLSVEEQFYVVLPPFLMLVWRIAPRRIGLALVAVAAGSLTLSVLGVASDAKTAYFLPQTRAWELFLGILLAPGFIARLTSPWLRAGCALLGLTLIAGCAVAYDSSTPFPGLAALPPCLGAALVVLAHRDGETPISRAMSFRPLVFLGLISYSLYLWHWPIVSFYSEHFAFNAAPSSNRVRLVLLLLMLGASTLSWRFVERPFRRGPAPRSLVFTWAVAAIVAAVCIGLSLAAFGGLPQRFPPAVVRMASYLDYDSRQQFRTGSCFIGPRQHFSDFASQTCLKREAAGSTLLLMGDSYAAHLYAGLAETLKDRNVLQASADNCQPDLGSAKASADCAQLNDLIFRRDLPANPVDMLVVATRRTPGDFSALGRVIDWAQTHGMIVVVVGAPPEYDDALPALLARSALGGEQNLADLHRSSGQVEADQDLATFVRSRGARFADSRAALCPNDACLTVTADGRPLQFDKGHLTREGSRLLARRLVAAGAFATPARDTRPDHLNR